jgi:hypothetical protein
MTHPRIATANFSDCQFNKLNLFSFVHINKLFVDTFYCGPKKDVDDQSGYVGNETHVRGQWQCISLNYVRWLTIHQT